jgi:hypothetical protein
LTAATGKEDCQRRNEQAADPFPFCLVAAYVLHHCFPPHALGVTTCK